MPNVVDRLGGASSSLAFKAPCRLSTTAAITLSGFQAIDGVTPTSSEHVDLRRILVRHQSDSAENGIYIMDTGTWERAKDFDGANDFRRGTRVFVWGGSTQSGGYVVTSSMDPSSFEFDEDDIDFTAQAAVDITNWEFADGTGLYDDSGNETLILRKSSSAANYVEVYNTAAGVSPLLSAAGSDTNLALLLSGKGTGGVTLLSGVNARVVMAAVNNSTAAVNYLQVLNASSGNPAEIQSAGSDSNIDLKLTPKGTGAVSVTGGVSVSSAASVSGALTANGGITSTAITASGLITGSAGVSVSSSFTSSGNINAVSGTTLTVGGVAGKAIMLFGSTTFGIYAGSSAPAIAAGQGSIYLRNDGGSSLTRAYIQSSGSTNTWVGLLTTA